MDSGSTSPTLCVTVSCRPAMSTGTVSTAVRPSIVERGPLTCTVAGSTATRRIAWSGSGVPRIWGTTRSVLATAPASLTWRRAGVTRLTTTPGGVCTRSGERATTFSPSRIPLRLARTRTAPGVRRVTAEAPRLHGGVHLARDRERDPPGLLGDDDRDRVRLLGDPERRPVPRAERAAHLEVSREREEAARRGDARPLDEHGAVVER